MAVPSTRFALGERLTCVRRYIGLSKRTGVWYRGRVADRTGQDGPDARAARSVDGSHVQEPLNRIARMAGLLNRTHERFSNRAPAFSNHPVRELWF